VAVSKKEEAHANEVSTSCRLAIVRKLPEAVRNTMGEGNFTHELRKYSGDAVYRLELAHLKSGRRFTATTIVRSLSDSRSRREEAGRSLAETMIRKIRRFKAGSGKKYFDEDKEDKALSDKLSYERMNTVIADSFNKTHVTAAKFFDSSVVDKIKEAQATKETPAPPACKLCGPNLTAPWPVWEGECSHVIKS